MDKLYLISYDLIKDKDYTPLIESIKKFSAWWHQTGSVWLVTSSLNSIHIREQLSQYLDADDKLFIVKINSIDWAAKGFNQKEYEWLHNRMKELNITNQ